MLPFAHISMEVIISTNSYNIYQNWVNLGKMPWRNGVCIWLEMYAQAGLHCWPLTI